MYNYHLCSHAWKMNNLKLNEDNTSIYNNLKTTREESNESRYMLL